MKREEYDAIMAEPLPNSLNYGFVPGPDLIESARLFEQTPGAYQWRIDMCIWSIRRDLAELIEHGTGKDSPGYGGWCSRNLPYSVKWEAHRIEELARDLAGLYDPYELADQGATWEGLYDETARLLETNPAALLAWVNEL